MAFDPIRMASPAGVVVLVGSAVERETLLQRGYTLAPAEAPKPVAKPAPKPVAEQVERPAAADKKPAPSK